jgi:apolipoprotein N-acyltransferase
LNRELKGLLARLAVAVASGLLLRWVVALTPLWWLAWLAPVPLLLLAFQSSARQSRWLVLLAALIATSVNLPYLRLVMPLPFALLVVLLQALLWVLVVAMTRRVVVGARSAWAVLAYPVFAVAADTLMAALLPDGNWGSLAYTQADVLPVVQLAALLGVPGLLFVVALVPAALAWAIYRRGNEPPWPVLGGVALVLLATLGYGTLRLRQPLAGETVTVGLAAIDDPIGPEASSPYAEPILDRYAQQVAGLATDGAQLVLLPEKLAVLRPVAAAALQARLAGLAAMHKVWLLAGVGIDDGQAPRNHAWLFDPTGRQAASYEKHKLAPPERAQHYAHGSDYALAEIMGRQYGIAICKDMHFASVGRAYGGLHAAVMLVPAWDFDHRDQWLESRTTTVRGIENGYAIVRAGRESLLSVSDAYGRVLAERPSRPMPGSTLLLRLQVAAPLHTLYTLVGDAAGWLCVLGAAAMLYGRWRRPATMPPPGGDRGGPRRRA